MSLASVCGLLTDKPPTATQVATKIYFFNSVFLVNSSKRSYKSVRPLFPSKKENFRLSLASVCGLRVDKLRTDTEVATKIYFFNSVFLVNSSKRSYKSVRPFLCFTLNLNVAIRIALHYSLVHQLPNDKNTFLPEGFYPSQYVHCLRACIVAACVPPCP